MMGRHEHDRERIAAAADEAAEEAARWFARLRERPRDPELLAAFRAWLDAGLANRRAYGELQEIWEQLGGLAPVETGERPGPQPARRELRLATRLAAAVAGLLLIAGGTLHALGEAPWQWERVETARGEQRTLMLEDGTTVYLNTATRLAVRMTAHRRTVRLKAGEALFEVTHDPSRPFLVEGALGTVRVVGTRFDVALDGDRGRMQVVVVEGEVAVTPAAAAAVKAAPLSLTPGEMATIDAAGVRERRVGDPERLISWREGYLVFDGSPLSEVVESINRYLPRPVRIADAGIADLKVTAVVRLEDREAIVQALTAALPVKALRLENGTTLLFADQAPPAS